MISKHIKKSSQIRSNPIRRTHQPPCRVMYHRGFDSLTRWTFSENWYYIAVSVNLAWSKGVFEDCFRSNYYCLYLDLYGRCVFYQSMTDLCSRGYLVMPYHVYYTVVYCSLTVDRQFDVWYRIIYCLLDLRKLKRYFKKLTNYMFLGLSQNINSYWADGKGGREAAIRGVAGTV